MNTLKRQEGHEARPHAAQVAGVIGVPKIFLDLSEVSIATTMSKTTIYEAMHKHGFPLPVRCGARRVAWKTAEVTAWCESRPKTDAAAAGGKA